MSQAATQSPWQNRIVDHGEVDPADLLAHPENWRIHSQMQQQALSSVLEKVGLVQSIVVNRRSGFVIDGHLRISLALRSGQQVVPVTYVDLSDAEERLILASLDPIGAMAGTDDEKLTDLLRSVDSEDVASLLEAVARQADIPREWRDEDDLRAGEDEVPDPPDEPITKLGDLWTLGRHRLLCGDSTSADDVTRLMHGQRAALMATDPPYLVDYEGGQHPASEANEGAATKDKHWDTYIDHAHSVEFYVDFLKVALAQALRPDAAIYQCYGIMRSEVVWESWRKAGLLAHQVLIWRKTRSVLTYSWYMWDYEPILVGWRQGKQPELKPPAEARAVWEIASTEGNEDAISTHPTVKPVELIRRPIRYHTRPGDVIYEPFDGSGTAIIAAQTTGRTCYAIEQSPAFVDAAVSRWESFTGETATCGRASQAAGRGSATHRAATHG